MRIYYVCMKKAALNLYADAKTRKRLKKLAERNRRSPSQEFSQLVSDAWEKFVVRVGEGGKRSESFNSAQDQHLSLQAA